MKKYISILLILIFCFVLRTPAQEINVLTYNIRYASFNNNLENWDQRKTGVFSILKGHDFIGLQEVLPVQMEDISTNFKNEYEVLFRTRDADSSVGEGSPILYNKLRWKLMNGGFFWLSDTPEIPGSNTWGAAFNRMVTFGFFQEIVSGDSILVINTHFDHISQAAREKSIKLIIDKYKSYINLMPVVFMGDLNTTPENPVYKDILTGTSLIDSYFFIHPLESVQGATSHGWNAEPPVNRIDYIFVSQFLDITDSEVLHVKYNENYPSDHFPVLSLLTLKK